MEEFLEPDKAMAGKMQRRKEPSKLVKYCHCLEAMSHNAHDPLSSAGLQPPPGGCAPCECLSVLSMAQECGMPYRAIMTERGDTSQALRAGS